MTRRSFVPRSCPEAQAWVRVAEHIANGEPMPFGLCDVAFHVTACYGALFFAMKRRTMRHVEAFVGESLDGGYRYAYKPGTEREARTLAALWLALEAAEEQGQ